MNRLRQVQPIIADVGETLSFIEWLPDLQDGEVFCCNLIARRKYSTEPNPSFKDGVVKRFTVYRKDRLLRALKQLEVPKQSYGTEDFAFAVYITVNPRSLRKASINTAKRLIDDLSSGNTLNPEGILASEIHKAKSRTCVVSFDFDTEKRNIPLIQESLKKTLTKGSYSIVETHGGAHVLVKPSLIEPALKKSWYHTVANLQENYSSDNNRGDIMLPVPGTYQGGFVPSFYYISITKEV